MDCDIEAKGSPWQSSKAEDAWVLIIVESPFHYHGVSNGKPYLWTLFA